MFKERINNRAKDAFRKKTLQGVMPTATASWPKLTTPESFQGGPLMYTTGLVYSPEEAEKISAVFDELLDYAFEQLPAGKKKTTTKVNPVKPEIRKVNAGTEQEDYEETGNFIVRTKTYALTQDGKSKTLPILDSAANVLSRPPEIAGGSRINVQVDVVPYWMQGNLGLTLYIKAVQIIELSAGYSDPSSAFEAVDGGYTAAGEMEAAVEQTDTPF